MATNVGAHAAAHTYHKSQYWSTHKQGINMPGCRPGEEVGFTCYDASATLVDRYRNDGPSDFLDIGTEDKSSSDYGHI